jgi:hypothetical protein
MEAIKKNPGLYSIHLSIPIGDEKKFEWIHQQGCNCGHFEVPTRYYRLKTAEELKQDKIFVSEIKYDTMVATFGDMCYLDRLPQSLHQYFDYTIELRSNNKILRRVNADGIVDGFEYAIINIMRNNLPMKF